MFSVIFEVHPAEGKRDAYLRLAKELKPMIEMIDGFIDNERFESPGAERLVAVALDLARREIGDPLADAGEASSYPGEGPIRGLLRLSPARRRDCG